MMKPTPGFPIDLSALTETEIDQFRNDPSTLLNGEIPVCLYLRFSSDKQKEQSIEGQLRDCCDYCARNGYRIAAVYADRATSARTAEKRVQLMDMISDSARGHWRYVIVWKLDRFARNRNDSAILKMRLRKYGVKVLSATEHLSDNPESILLESVLEGMAEFFSAELSQKVTRGMRESALKCQSTGGLPPLGYKIVDHKLAVDPETAPIAREIFQMYANGVSCAEMCRRLNARGYKTASKQKFGRSSFRTMLRNERYIGVYTYKDIRVEGAVPAIIEPELFAAVGKRLSSGKVRNSHGNRAKVDYLLAGKVFCGHCGSNMDGECGHSKGRLYNYYACYSHKRKTGCEKRPIRKEYLERVVVSDAMQLLTEQTIQEMADMAIAQSQEDMQTHTRIPQLTARKKEVEQGISNIVNAVEKGVASDTLLNRLTALEQEQKDLVRLLQEEERYTYHVDREQVVFWLRQFQNGSIEDEDFRRHLIDLFINSVTVWDEPDGYRVTTVYNLTSCKEKTFRLEGLSGMNYSDENISGVPA